MYNASNKRRPDKGVRWRRKAGTNLIALLSGWTFTTQSIGWRIGKPTGSREGFLESKGLRRWATLSQNVQLLRCLFNCGNVTSRYPPKHNVCLTHFMEPLFLAAHDLNVGRPVNVIMQSLDRIPEGKIHDFIGAEIVNAGSITVFGL